MVLAYFHSQIEPVTFFNLLCIHTNKPLISCMRSSSQIGKRLWEKKHYEVKINFPWQNGDSGTVIITAYQFGLTAERSAKTFL